MIDVAKSMLRDDDNNDNNDNNAVQDQLAQDGDESVWQRLENLDRDQTEEDENDLEMIETDASVKGAMIKNVKKSKLNPVAVTNTHTKGREKM